MAKLRTVVCSAVALLVGAVFAGPAAATINERRILDGCEVGGGGNDIHSVESSYEEDRNEILVILRLCDEARRDATYRVHLDHAAPFVEEAGALAECETPADSVVARTPGGHKGVGTSEETGNLVRFVVPLDDLDVGAPEEVPQIPLWATSRLGGIVDHAPNREKGDRCTRPQARTETLMQPRIEQGSFAFVSSFVIDGAIGVDADEAIGRATALCRSDVQKAGITDTGNTIAWLSTSTDDAKSRMTNPIRPIVNANGEVVANTVADLADCTKGPPGDLCLRATIDRDVFNNEVTEQTWTGTLPGGTADSPNCHDWTSNSANDQGSGGFTLELDARWTTGVEGPCDQRRRLICFHIQSG